MRTTEAGGNPVRGAICADVDGQGIIMAFMRCALLGRSGDPSLAGPQPTLQPSHTLIHTVKLRQWSAALCTSRILIVFLVKITDKLDSELRWAVLWIFLPIPLL